MNRPVFRAVTLCGAALAMLAALPSSAQAPAKEPKIKLDTLKPDKIQLDPRLGYILVRMGPKADKADKPIPVAFQRIDEKTGRAFKFEDGEAPPSDFFRTLSTSVNTGRSLADKDGAGTYVVAAFPGRWIISGVDATCLAMGTYSFDVKQGEIADIGTILTAREDGKSPAPELKGAVLSQDLVDFGVMMNIVMTATAFVKASEDEPVLPAPLQALTRSKAVLSPDYRSENTCLGMFGRAASLPPIGHQPPMTAEEGALAIAKINPEALVRRKQEKLEKAAKVSSVK